MFRIVSIVKVTKTNAIFWAVMLLCTAFFMFAGWVPVAAGSQQGTDAPDQVLSVCSPDGRIETAASASMQRPDRNPDAPTATYADEVVRLINLERRDLGLLPYKLNPILTGIAVEHSTTMRDAACFSHQCPGEVPPAQRACDAGLGAYGWGGCYVGETIAAGFPDPSSVVNAWLTHTAHRDILLNEKLREIGVGYVPGGSYGAYWTADFGSQPGVLPVFINGGEGETSSRQVDLVLTNETVSNWGGMGLAHEVMIANEPGFVQSSWESFAPEKTWMLSRCGGQKSVYIRYRDTSGNELISHDSIVFNEPVAYDLELNDSALTFSCQVGSGPVAETGVSVAVDNAESCAPMDWYAVSTGGATWLNLTPSAGRTPALMNVSVDGFACTNPGAHTAVVTVLSPQDTNGTEKLTVTVQAREESSFRVLVPLVLNARR